MTLKKCSFYFIPKGNLELVQYAAEICANDVLNLWFKTTKDIRLRWLQ